MAVVSLCPYSSCLTSPPTAVAGDGPALAGGRGLLTVRAADTLLCLGRGEVAELSGLCFEIGVAVTEFVIFPCTSGQQGKFSLDWFDFILFCADLEAREREAQTHESEEEDIRITRSLDQEVMIHS